MDNDVRMQGNLGNVKSVTRKDIGMNGMLALAKIIKVYHKNNTVDVKLIRDNNLIRSSDKNEGRFACRVLCSNAGFDKDNQVSWGVVEPLAEGQLVVVAFLDGYKSEPVIISSMHYVDSTNNILTSKFPLEPYIYTYDFKENRKYLRVFPLQDYFRLDGYGDLEFVLHSKSFLTWTRCVSDKSTKLGGTDFEDLSEKNKQTGKTLCIPKDYNIKYMGNNVGQAGDYVFPKDFLLVFRDNFDDALTTWTKIYANMSDPQQKGLIRVTREPNDGTLSYIEISRAGQIKLRRQLDSIEFNGGEQYAEITIGFNGAIVVKRGQSTLQISDSEIKIDSKNVVINGINFSTHKHTCPVSGTSTSSPF